MLCNEFSSVLEQEGLSPLPPAAQDHLAACGHCQNLMADLSSIVACAHQFPAEVEPPARTWVSLRAQMEAEGVIREVPADAYAPIADWLSNLRSWFSPRALATAGVGLILAIAAFLQFQKPTVAPSQSTTLLQPKAASPVPQVVAQTVPQIAQKVAAPVAPSVSAPSPATVAPSVLATSRRQATLTSRPADTLTSSTTPSDDFYLAMPAALNQAENELPRSGRADNPAVEASLRKNLRTVNNFIAECEKHVKKHPEDMLAREYLNSAYQQKAELIAALLDSGRSEQ
jgi:hypothetical protein